MIFTNTSVDLVLPVGTRDHSQGMIAAPLACSLPEVIVLVEYIDYQCPYCAQAVGIVRELQYELGDRLCYVVRHFPIVDLHREAMRAAEATEAAAAQNQFWQMHYSLFEIPSALSETNIFHYARKLGLDSDLFERDLNNDHHLRHIQEDIKTGMESGVNSTPTFFINGVRHLGNWDTGTLLNAMPHHGSYANEHY
jgi:protein-disulfide isomerase